MLVSWLKGLRALLHQACVGERSAVAGPVSTVPAHTSALTPHAYRATWTWRSWMTAIAWGGMIKATCSCCGGWC